MLRESHLREATLLVPEGPAMERSSQAVCKSHSRAPLRRGGMISVSLVSTESARAEVTANTIWKKGGPRVGRWGAWWRRGFRTCISGPYHVLGTREPDWGGPPGGWEVVRFTGAKKGDPGGLNKKREEHCRRASARRRTRDPAVVRSAWRRVAALWTVGDLWSSRFHRDSGIGATAQIG